MSRISQAGLSSAILTAGLLTGALDILAALISAYLRTHTTPADVFRFIASGIFGVRALSGGIGMAMLGLLFHFCIATIWSALYFLMYSQIRSIARYWIPTGLVYGLMVWQIMNWIVLPLSHVPQVPFSLSGAVRGAVILMLMVGLPNAYLATRFYGTK